MPIEIRELVIRAVVNSSDEKNTAPAANAQASKSSVVNGLEKMMELIKNKNER